MLMQLRDEGRLTLDDLLADHLPDVGHPVTVRQALAHVSGMQREPLGDVWDTLEQPDAASLVRGFAEAERVGRPHTRWHYSNLAYAVLGQVVEKLDGRPWVESLRDAVAAPARDAPDHGGVRRRRPRDGLLRAAVPRRTPGGAGAGPPRHDPGRGPRQHGARPGPLVGVRRLTPDEVLSPDTLEEMCQPQVLLDTERWNGGMGLGLFVLRYALGPHVGRPRRRNARSPHRAAHAPRERDRWHRADEQHRRSRPRGPGPRAGRPGGRGPAGRGRALAPRHRRCPRSSPASSAAGTPRDAASSSPCARAGSRPVRTAPLRPAPRRCSRRRAPTATAPSPAASAASCCASPVTPTAAVDRLHWATYVFTRAPLGFGEHLR